MTPELAAAIAMMITVALEKYKAQGKIPTKEEIVAGYTEIQAIIDSQK